MEEPSESDVAGQVEEAPTPASSSVEAGDGAGFKMPSVTPPTSKRLSQGAPEPPTAPQAPAPRRVKKESSKDKQTPLPYTEPPWGGNTATQNYTIEVLKGGSIVETIALDTQPFYVFGRLSECDIQLQHPSTSRFHAVLQYRAEADGDDNPQGFYIYDLKSTHGTFLNKQRLKPEVFAPVRVGHMIQIGGSTRMLILQGPDEDAEPESPFTVTELIAQKRERELEMQRMEAQRIADQKALEEKRRLEEEAAGIDWGMGEDAEEEPDLSENPFASTGNESLYLADPKRSLRGWFEREGEELHYDCQEKTNGQFLCRVTLPVDDDSGRALVAEALVRGKKKEAVVQCALEACRLLDRQGLLRNATHESKSRKKKEWEDESDSDDDTFLDRTGAVEQKRQRKLEGKAAPKVQTYETLVEELEKVREQIKTVEEELARHDKIISKKESSVAGEQDELDAFMLDLKRDTTQDKIKRRAAKTQLMKLQQDERRLVKMANIARPATLPELKVQTPEVAQKAPFVGTKPALKPKTSATAVKESSEVPVYQSFEGEEEEDEEEPDAKPEVPAKSREEESPKPKKAPSKQPQVETSAADRKLGPSIPAEFLAKLYEDKPLDDDDDDEGPREPKRQRVRTRAGKSEKPKDKHNYDDESGDYSTWVPPKDQSGDGRTKLNDKLGY